MDTIDLTNPQVRARVEYLGAHAERSIVQDFLEKYPELLNPPDVETDIRNRQAVEEIMNQHGLALTPENLEWSLRAAVEAGKIEVGMYSLLEQQAFPRMTTAQLRDYLERQYQAPRPPNQAEFLPTEGERRWRSDTSAMSEEQLAALREKLLRGMRR